MQRRIDTPSLETLGPSARAVVRELLVSGPLPRAELARRMGLSAASLTKTTRPLLDAAVIHQDEPGDRETRGRPGTPLALDAARHQFIGFKVTGTELFAVRADAAGRVEATDRCVLDTYDVDAVVDLIVDIVNKIGAGHRVEAIGIGVAGMLRRFDDTVRHNIYLGWHDVPLARLVEQRTGIPTVLSGDARALTAGVQWSGPGRGLDDFAVVTVGVGIGLGLVAEGRVLAGPGGNAALIGHTRVSDSGPLCPLGHRGCASSFLTTEAITNAVGVPLGRPELDLGAACALAAEANPVARRVFDDAGRALGVLIANVVNMLGIPAIILAGDGLEMIAHARPVMDDVLAEHLDPWASPPQIEVFSTDFDEWARGAAVVACQWLLVDPPDPD